MILKFKNNYRAQLLIINDKKIIKIESHKYVIFKFIIFIHLKSSSDNDIIKNTVMFLVAYYIKVLKLKINVKIYL
jgi:hypothetical protein